MPTVDILVTGYVKESEEAELVQPTISLVRAPGMTLIVDPGILRESSTLADALAEKGLKPTDVTHVFLTHHHIDHTRNVGIFPKASVYDVDSIYQGDIWAEHDGDDFELTEGVRIIATPGHSKECASLVVDTADGTVVLTHAWWFSDMTPAEDPMADNQSALEESREKILGIADIVVPGHGAPFTVSKR